MEVIEIVQRFVGYEVEIERHPRRLGDQLRTRADIAKARALLDYAPCVDPEEGLSETVAWFQERARSASHAAVLR
jgi:nucleoside-diphosphate-sugar epimerase